jgi:hypothetical protein
MPSIDSEMASQGYGRGGEPGASFGEAFPWGQAFQSGATDLLDTIAPARTKKITNVTEQTQFGPAAIQEIIYQALSGQGGVAAIQTQQNISGGYGSSTAKLQLADLIANTAGEIGKATGPKRTTGESNTKKKKSVICTKLNEMGKLDTELYHAGKAHFEALPDEVVCGYRSWACGIAEKLPTSPKLTAVCAYVANKRYTYIVYGTWNLVGWLTVVVAEPICGLIGKRTQYA